MARNKKAVDYSQFGDLDNDDEDFAFSSAPPSKKPRVESKKEKKEKPVKKSNKEENLFQQTSPGKRLPLDEKLYQRDLEVALALSVQKTTAIVESREENGVATFTDETNERADYSFSNCSVDSSTLGLDEITSGNEDQLNGRNRRQAASKAIFEQRKLLADDSDHDEVGDEFKPDVAYDESESEEDFSGEDEEFDLKNTKKSKANKGTKQKAKSEKKEKSLPKPKINAYPVSSPVPTKAKSLPAKKTPTPSPAPVKQAIHHSPSVGMKKPTWSPPATVGSVKHSLGGVTVKSPSQGLRLGLSRLARIKPLHPAVVKH
ncbi:RAD51-associated protein 1 isoform X2 [Xenopus laevis]|uniref:RAD51 interacting motif domain-containing protein n=2 Tax=Xenopus laevis TaxID=8355 RepID=A0A974H807_XENLA|nr:RAD51-associated protein 1 isoform X2 [Xenopus laevis]OCT67985.1 hypothetical protein XELAEV_18039282mg [Xenopus laevis]